RRPEPRVWVKWGKFEEERAKLDKARKVFQTTLEFFRDDEEQIEKAQAVLNAFTKMEIGLKEYERARGLFTRCFALSRLPRSKSAALYAAYTKFEKQHGTRSTLESTVLGKRRIQYEELTHDGRNYDVWFDYARLEEGALRDLREEGATREEEERATNRVSEVYERAVAQVPPGGEKRHWRRYIFLWLYYALFEEIETKDYERPRQIYETAIRVVPHKQFTFAKLWIMFARFEVRQLKLPAARKILGTAIGMCPKEALFKGYIQLEFDLREFDRVRTLYEKYIEVCTHSSAAWIKYAELESQLEDYARVRAIYELGVSQTALSMPELLWKAYIDFETKEGEREKARALYERLVQTSGHVKVWISYATFEAEPIPIVRARAGGGGGGGRGPDGRGRPCPRTTGVRAWLQGSQEQGLETGAHRPSGDLEGLRGEVRRGRRRGQGAGHDAHHEQAPYRRQRDWPDRQGYVFPSLVHRNHPAHPFLLSLLHTGTSSAPTTSAR
ncbi:hypothetical protein C8Q78DRAFT_1115406, partial [Trametes maxima]